MTLSDERDRHFMRRALQLAELSFAQQEVPVGALIVIDDRIIAEGRNRVEERSDPTAHAEMEAIRAACTEGGNWRLVGADLFTTLEPCAMCLGAAINSRCRRIIWAADDLRQGAGGSWCHLLALPHPIHNPQMHSGCLRDASCLMLRSFFRARRLEKKRLASKGQN